MNYPATERNWYNSRTKYWGLAKKWLEQGSIPEDKDLLQEGPSLLYTFDKQGRFQLESKELAAKRGVNSPDTFDALAYSFAANPDPTMLSGGGSPNPADYGDNQISISWY
jgi:hypothetical protein